MSIKPISPISLAVLIIWSVGAAVANADDPFNSPMALFKDALVPALSNSERGKVQTTWRGFYIRADRQSQMINEREPSESGIFLDVEVRADEEISLFSDTSSMAGGITQRKVCFPPINAKLNQGMVITLKYGASANVEALKTIEACITQIKSKIERTSGTNK